MPQPIIPIHQLNNLDSLFVKQNTDLDFSLGLSSPSNQKVAAKYSELVYSCLESISKEEEELITAASTLASSGRNSQSYYRAPNTVSDNELIGLKTQGLVAGSGRLVTITDKGKTALRDRWLTSNNNLKANKIKDGYDHPRKFAHISDDNTTERTSEVNTERVRKVINKG